ncbi:IclR family transcriptional regulator [Bifidobacterium sp. ESL0732]|uniref:IclR family transcriptional regulator n=1 Tax=Bifidobacterium sp. ESL0732 TaxID=2983222 RepID=UPI0023F89200|nr:IclR family transcriptional regulator [Bifidobacterium sp. ESL0732]WEV64318.1 IclR family transcriptional regulator [Bifidobacterium sp. ESL0732]
MAEIENEKEPNGVLFKAGKVVEALADDNGMGPAEIADVCDIPRSSVYRILDGLTDVGLVESNSGVSYSLSLDWLRFADAARNSLTEWSNATDLLHECTGNVGLTSFLTMVSGYETVCVQWAKGPGNDALILRPGGTLPFFGGAAGRVCLAYSSEEIGDAYLRNAPFEGYNENSLVTASALRRDMRETLARGYAISDEDVTIGVGSIGVPIFGSDGKTVVGALSTGGFVDVVLPRGEELAQTLFDYVGRLGEFKA